MYLSVLSDRQKDQFLNFACLVSLCGGAVLWDGKKESELTGTTDLTKISINTSDGEKEAILSLAEECGHQDDDWRIKRRFENIEKALLEKIKLLPLSNQNDPSQHLTAATSILNDIESKGDAGLNLEGFIFAMSTKISDQARTTAEQEPISPSVPKIMVYELMQFCLASGGFSSIKLLLLKEISRRIGLKDFLFDDLLERAESVQREIKRTTSIIFE